MGDCLVAGSCEIESPEAVWSRERGRASLGHIHHRSCQADTLRAKNALVSQDYCPLRIKSQSLPTSSSAGVLELHSQLIHNIATKMPREPEPSIIEKAFVLQALQEGVRVDGRQLDEFRRVDVSFGDEYGVADVRLGKTR